MIIGLICLSKNMLENNLLFNNKYFTFDNGF